MRRFATVSAMALLAGAVPLMSAPAEAAVWHSFKASPVKGGAAGGKWARDRSKITVRICAKDTGRDGLAAIAVLRVAEKKRTKELFGASAGGYGKVRCRTVTSKMNDHLWVRVLTGNEGGPARIGTWQKLA
ncbi:hypothetical protein [Actinomadura macrotermitis]|uniref:Secreted protein n=1 Tax=Actinomadura macrotermitis TaxID=2585200 RepID=A0A7K0BUT7_9ACTN|nr:hypothetical protein [Actinomadura macrotermitis]MQY04970.1 hypothetical protein [Actinomadura macrotermitis]